jgi:hypothetical protein
MGCLWWDEVGSVEVKQGIKGVLRGFEPGSKGEFYLGALQGIKKLLFIMW